MSLLLKSISKSVVQDIATAGAGWLSVHGYLHADQTQSFIGATFFLGMLAVNAVLEHKQAKATE